MGKVNDLTGKVFANGSVTVLHRADNDGSKNAKWVCQCKCGETFVAYGFNLKSGNTTSCGCLKSGELPDDMMKRPSISLYKLRSDPHDPYQNLANAIVAVAADDYRMALQDSDEKLIKSLEQFFFSDWYRILTNINPESLIRLLQRENKESLTAVYI